MRESGRDREKAQRTAASCHAPHTQTARNTRSRSVSRAYRPILRIPRTYTHKLASKGSSRCTDRAEKSGHWLSCISHTFRETALGHNHVPEQIRAPAGILLLPGAFQAAGLSRPRSEL